MTSAVSVISDLRWLNYYENFLFTIDNEVISLYEITQEYDFTYNNALMYSSALFSAPVRQDHEYLRCFAQDHTSDNYVAFGFNTGRISIIKIDIDATMKTFRNEEIWDVQKKSITSMSWHYYDNNKFCLTYERDDPNLIVVSTPRCLRLADVRERNGFQTTVNVQTAQLGICTEPNMGYRIACHSRNIIYVFDRRFISMPIHEVTLGMESHSINKLSWHPTRLFHMSCVIRETGSFYNFAISPKAYGNITDSLLEKPVNENFKHTFEQMSNDYKYATLYQSMSGFSRINSFDWHPNVNNKLAVFCSSRNLTKTIHVVKQRCDISSTMSACGEFAYSDETGVYIVKQIEEDQQKSEENEKLLAHLSNIGKMFRELDLAAIMKRRLKNNYGYGSTNDSLTTIIENSKNTIENDIFASNDLKFCWRWIDRLYQANDQLDYQKLYCTRFPGIRHIIKDMKSSSSTKHDDITFRNRIFVNDKRDRILKICGWAPFEDHATCKLMLDEMMDRKTVQYQVRAAALALFFVQGVTCKQYLMELGKLLASESFQESKDPEFVARYSKMTQLTLDVLSKFNGIKVPDYEQVCREMTDNYLLAVIKFLTRREDYNTIHNEIMSLKNIKIEDKLAFAAIHLDDELLNLALDRFLNELVAENCPLTGLIITGLDDHSDSHKLIHKYINSTQDIQTASIFLLIGSCFRKKKSLNDLSFSSVKICDFLTTAIESESFRSPRRQSLHCIRDYMELLNNWSFYVQKTFLSSFFRDRSNFDESVEQIRPSTVQAVIACNFCSVPVYPSNVERIEALRQTNSSAALLHPRRTDRTRLMSCFKCRKPLPKCTICRKHFGSLAETMSTGNDFYPNVHSPIDHWFVWCCNCNHGGHLSHIRSWFLEYVVCPASGCQCLCMDRDQQLRDEIFIHSKKLNVSTISDNSDNVSSRIYNKPNNLLNI